MRKLMVFNSVTVDGYFTGANGDMSWAHRQDPEWNAYVEDNARNESEMLFGRITYEMMASFWPTPQAIQMFPVVAEGMNRAPKVVFSRTLDKVSWSNARVVKDDPAGAVRKLKDAAGPTLLIMGSGTIVSQLARQGLIDEYQIVVNPIVLGKGKTMFDGLEQKLALKQTRTRAFENGNVLLCYERQA